VVLLPQSFSALAALRFALPSIFCPSVLPGTTTYKVPVSAGSNQPSLWVYLSAPQIPGDVFFLLVEKGDFASLKICTVLCLSCNSEMNQLHFPHQNPNHLVSLGPSGLSTVWMSLQTPEDVSLTSKELAISIIELKNHSIIAS